MLLNLTSKASYQEISAVTSLCPIHTFCSGKPVLELMFAQFMYTPLQEVPSQHSDCSHLPKHLLQLLLPTWNMLPSCQHGTCIAFCTLHSPAYRTALFAVLPKDLVSLHFQSCSAQLWLKAAASTALEAYTQSSAGTQAARNKIKLLLCQPPGQKKKKKKIRSAEIKGPAESGKVY